MAGDIHVIVEPVVLNVVESDSGIDVIVDDTQLLVEVSATGPQGPQGQWQEYFETVSKNLKSYPAVFSYVGGELSTIAYTTPSGVITKTFNRSGGKLVSIVLSGATPLGITLTKTLSYTGDDLTGITYG